MIHTRQISKRSWRAWKDGGPLHKARTKTAAIRAARHDARGTSRPRKKRRNPDAPVEAALTWLGGGAVVGAGLGALTQTDRPVGALNGAASGVALVGIGGLVAALFSKPNRPAGFATAGIGLGGLALLGLAISIVRPSGTGLGLPYGSLLKA